MGGGGGEGALYLPCKNYGVKSSVNMIFPGVHTGRVAHYEHHCCVFFCIPH